LLYFCDVLLERFDKNRLCQQALALIDVDREEINCARVSARRNVAIARVYNFASYGYQSWACRTLRLLAHWRRVSIFSRVQIREATSVKSRS
jgi:hypothetical protein